jgi:hypothetical protein
LVIGIKHATIGLGFVLLLAAAGIGSASAITVEIARACEAAAAKAFPPRQVGNPAAGTSKGTGKDRRDYYNKCVANNGKADDVPGQTPNNASK